MGTGEPAGEFLFGRKAKDFEGKVFRPAENSPIPVIFAAISYSTSQNCLSTGNNAPWSVALAAPVFNGFGVPYLVLTAELPP